MNLIDALDLAPAPSAVECVLRETNSPAHERHARGALIFRPGRFVTPFLIVDGAIRLDHPTADDSTVLLALCVAMIVSLVGRTPLKVDVVRDRAALSRIVSGGKLENVYRLQIMNATEATRSYQITATGMDGIQVLADPHIEVGPAESRWVLVRLQIPYGSAGPGSHKVMFEVVSEQDGSKVIEKSVFLVPR